MVRLRSHWVILIMSRPKPSFISERSRAPLSIVVVSIGCPEVVVRYVIFKSVAAGAGSAAGRLRVRWATNVDVETTTRTNTPTEFIPQDLFLMTLSRLFSIFLNRFFAKSFQR